MSGIGIVDAFAIVGVCILVIAVWGFTIGALSGLVDWLDRKWRARKARR
uniref:Uncharacterized protein n=1 Tax=Micrococcus phage Kurnik TaxID=3092208 RepID=A0AAU6R672_9CAUD